MEKLEEEKKEVEEEGKEGSGGGGKGGGSKGGGEEGAGGGGELYVWEQDGMCFLLAGVIHPSQPLLPFHPSSNRHKYSAQYIF